MPASTYAERIAERSRAFTIAALLLLTLLAWVYLLSGAGMKSMPPMHGTGLGWTLAAAMWIAMMVAMMLPSAAPAILLYARVHRHSFGEGTALPVAAFLTGYLACWFGFALIAATLQLVVTSPMSMAVEGRIASSIMLVAAGAYQLSPLKDACLSRCRSPAEFITRHYRPGNWGAARLGLLHGVYCVGCCWLLMALLFVGGVMNLLWVAGLTLLIAAEKLLAGGKWIARIAGLAMIGWGGALLLS
jgi:predicted metal-binding membrane protein